MMYNAVVRNVPYMVCKEVMEVDLQISRLFLKDNDLSLIPEGWPIYFRGARISRSADIGNLMCTAADPIKIYKGTGKRPEEFQLFVKGLLGETNTYEARWNDTVEELKLKVEKRTGVSVDSMRLIYGGSQVEDGKLLWEYNITQESTLHKVLRLRGGAGGFVTQDVEAEQIAGFAETTDVEWEGYSSGMNLYGSCPNKKCPSRRNGQSVQVVFNARYGTILLSPERITFECPACKVTSGDQKNSALVPISNFVLASGRAIFRFKKSGAGNEVRRVIMESLGPVENYKTFDMNAGKSEYDFMDVTTVTPESSFYFCAKCDKRISKIKDEVVCDCGHTFHQACVATATTTKARRRQCLVCEAKQFDSVYDFLAHNTGSTQDKSVLVSYEI